LFALVAIVVVVVLLVGGGGGALMLDGAGAEIRPRLLLQLRSLFLYGLSFV
jgi:hypothetical protein